MARLFAVHHLIFAVLLVHSLCGVGAQTICGRVDCNQTDYAIDGIEHTFPNCGGLTTPNGGGFFIGLRFERFRPSDGTTIWTESLGNWTKTDIKIGDELTMRWDGAPADCTDALVSCALMASAYDSFKEHEDQQLIRHNSTCLANAPGSVLLNITGESANFQIDCIIGCPLITVGPNGSYYSEDLVKNSTRGRNILVSSFNGGLACNVTFVVTVEPPLDGYANITKVNTGEWCLIPLSSSAALYTDGACQNITVNICRREGVTVVLHSLNISTNRMRQAINVVRQD